MSNLRNILSGVKKKSLTEILAPVKTPVRAEVPTLQQPIKSAITQAVGQVRSTPEAQPVERVVPKVKPADSLVSQLKGFAEPAQEKRATIQEQVKKLRTADLPGIRNLPVAQTQQQLKEAERFGITLIPPTPRDPEYKGFQESFAKFTAEEQPFGAGLVEEITPFAKKVDPTIAKALEAAEKESPVAFKAGEITGKTAELLGGYLAAGGIVGKLGMTGAKGFGAKQGMALLLDTIAQTPFEIVEFVNNDQSAPEDVKQYVKNRGVDAAFNLAFAGAGKLIGTGIEELRKLRQTGDPTVVEAIDKGIRNLTDAQQKTIQEELGLPPEMTAKEFLEEQTKVAEDVGIETMFRQFEEPTEQAVRQAPDLFPPQVAPEVSPQLRETLEQIRPTAPTVSMAEDIGIPSARVTPDVARLEIPVPKGEPIDTKDLVLTELPKTAKRDVADVVDRVRQELVSKNLPFEKVGKIAGSEELIAKGGNLNRITGTVDYNLGNAQSSMEGLDIGKSVKEIVEGIPEAQRGDFFDYVLNKHNVDRFAQGKPVFGESIDSVISNQNVAKLENPVFNEKQKEITRYFENLMQEWGVKSGLVSQETADALRELYPNYVPTYRALDIDRVMGGGTGFVKKALKKAKGSEKQILPIDQQMAFLTDKMIRNARKNEIMLSLDDVFTSNPEAVSRYIKSISDVAVEPVDDIIKVGTNLDKEVKRQGENFVINYYKNGQPKQMTVNKTMYEAMKTMEQDALDKGLGVVRKYATNPFKSLITTYNPLFAVRNIMRDVPTALIYSNDPIKMVKSVPQATQEMLSNGKLWKQYQALGGTRSGLFNYDKGVKFDFAGKKGLKEQVTSTLQSAGEKAEAINNFTETLPRFSEYVASINKGESPAVALMRSAEVTTDFARFGKQTKRADAVVPYLNASVQGLDKFARQMRDKPLQTMAKGSLVVTPLALTLDQVNKNNDQYNQMTARERNQYYHIPKEDGTFWRIPRSREVGVLFGTVFEWLNRARRGEDVTAEEVMSVAMENFTPVNGFDSNIMKPAENFWKIATGKDPDAKNFFGSKIVPTSLQRYSPEMQYDEKTTSIAKNLGSYFDVSPKAIDYLMDSYLGVIGDVGMPYLTDQEVDWKAPLERAFIADPVFKSESQNEFYDTLEEMRKRAQDLNKQHDIPSKVVTPIERETKILNRFNKQLSGLRKEQKAAQQAGDDEKARRIRKQMNDLSKVALEKISTEQELEKKLADFLNALEKRGR